MIPDIQKNDTQDQKLRKFVTKKLCIFHYIILIITSTAIK